GRIRLRRGSAPPLRRPGGPGAPANSRRDRPLLGRKRGLVARGRRSDLSRFPAGPLLGDLRLLLRDLPRAVVPHPPWDFDRVSQSCPRSRVAAHLGLLLLGAESPPAGLLRRGARQPAARRTA